MTATRSFMDQVAEAMNGFGPVTFCRMFGGAGVYADGLMFALIDRDMLYLKVDDASRADFEAAGSVPFTYTTRHGEGSLDSYWRAPERLFDEPDEMALWARRALDIARRQAVAKAQRSKPAKAKSHAARKR